MIFLNLFLDFIFTSNNDGINALKSNYLGEFNLGEVLVNTKNPENSYTLARQGKSFYFTNKKYLFSENAYNLLPPQIFLNKRENSNQIYINVSGMYLCATNNNVEGCLNKSKAGWRIEKIKNYFQIKPIEGNKCITKLNLEKENDRYKIGLKDCDEQDENQKIEFEKVTSRQGNANIEYLDSIKN